MTMITRTCCTAGKFVTWDNANPVAWRRALLNYFSTTNILISPVLSRTDRHHLFNYFMGSGTVWLTVAHLGKH
jgi:hypothetical protein